MFRQLAKNAYYRGLSASGAARRRIAELRKTGKIAVLNLHSVTPHGNDYWPPMRPEVFERLLIFLTSSFDVRGINELEKSGSDRPVAVLSFDDGYHDFLEFALPLLRKYNVRANMNVIPECVVTGRPMWNVRLYDFLSAADKELINEMKIPGFSFALDGESRQEKIRFGLRVSRHLKSRPRGEREEIWQSIEPYLDASDAPKTRMLNLDEVKQIAEFADIGAHSYSHESMGYEDSGFFENDFRQCRDFFADELSMKLDTYAFPNGSYRPEQIEFLRENGIENVLLVDERFADSGSRILPRITMHGESELEVRMRALNL